VAIKTHVKSNPTSLRTFNQHRSLQIYILPLPSLLLITIEYAEVRLDSKQNLPPRLPQCTCHDSTELSMSNTAEDTRAAAAPNPVDPIASPTGIVRHGHESLIAQPSTFLLPRGHNRAMAEKPLTAADKDQQQGLVSGAIFPHTP
jgi:hypothetical protein